MEVFKKIKNSILYHSDETKYRYEIGKAVIDECVKDIIKDLGLENNGWIPVEEKLPEDDGYILVSFSNYTLADVARYKENEEGGAFYPGDDEKSYVSYELFVNAWQPLPGPYVEGGEN